MLAGPSDLGVDSRDAWRRDRKRTARLTAEGERFSHGKLERRGTHACQEVLLGLMTPGKPRLPANSDGSLAEVSLMHQPFIRDQSRTMKDVVAEAIAKMGESIRVKRFVRFELGG